MFLVFVVRCVGGDEMMTRPSPCGLVSALMLAGTEPQEVSGHQRPIRQKIFTNDVSRNKELLGTESQKVSIAAN